MYIDLFVLFVFLFTTLIGFYRGFTKEIFGLLSLAGAIVISTTSNRWIVSGFLESTENQILVSTAVYVVTFVISIIVLNMIMFFIARLLNTENHSILDRIFGGIIGFIKAYAFCLFIYFVIYGFTAVLKPDFEDDKNIENVEEITPEWLKNSKSYPIFYESIVKLDHLVRRFSKTDNASVKTAETITIEKT